MNKLKDSDLREALSRREARRARPEVPADFCADIMQEIAPRKSAPKRRRWMAAAAGVLLIIGIAAAMMMKDERKTTESTTLAASERPKPKAKPYQPERTDIMKVRTEPSTAAARKAARPARRAVQEVEQKAQPQPDLLPMPAANLHYAAHHEEPDSDYQSPARMDEFIAEMAAYNKVEAVPLDCSSGNSDLAVVSTAYVFEDDQEFHLFARLLQAACWYDSQTPGYLLNFSHQQFFFTLKDMRRKEKYLWIAERIGGNRILLYATHSPTEAAVSSECFQKYREQLTLIKHNL